MLTLREPYRPAFAGSPLRRRANIGASASLIKQAAVIAATKLGESNLAAIQVAVAIGILETDLGTSGSWVCNGNCDVLDDGAASYNWGGLVGSGTAGHIDHGDRNPDGTPTHYNFQAFYSMQQAFAAFYGTWSRGNAGIDRPQSVVPHETTVLPAASRGDALAVATTMYAHKYFGGVAGNDQARILAYAKAIVGAAGVVAAALGQPALVTLSTNGGGGGGGSGVAWALLGVAVAGVGLWVVL